MKDAESGLTVSGLPLIEYERLRAADRELNELKKELAACSKIEITEIEKKEKKYREEKREVYSLERCHTVPEPEEIERIEKLGRAFYEEADKPQVVIDGNRATKIIMRYAIEGIPEEMKRRYGWQKLPDGAKVKIK